MKRFFTALMSLLLIFSLSACANEAEPISADTQTETEGGSEVSEETDMKEGELSQLSQHEINFPSLEEIQSEYPDKTVLVWTIGESGYDRNYPFRTREINEYLDSQGYDFAVCFYPVRVVVTKEQKDFFTVIVNDMLARGEQVDIIHSSFTEEEEGENNSYYKCVYNGLFEPLDGYFDTDIGQRLYKLMPEKHWDGLKVNGSIYGINCTPAAQLRLRILCKRRACGQVRL